MNDSQGNGLNDSNRPAGNGSEPQPRAAGAPLPIGVGIATTQTPVQSDSQRAKTAQSQGTALANRSVAAGEQRSSMQRAVSALRMALPIIQRVLPLIDGNIATAVSNILTPHPQTPPPPPPVNLKPIEDGLAEFRTQHRELRDQILEQHSSLKRVEDQLEMVREATDRNTLEQQELLEDLKTVGGRVNIFAFIALALLGVSVLLNVFLYLEFRHILP